MRAFNRPKGTGRPVQGLIRVRLLQLVEDVVGYARESLALAGAAGTVNTVNVTDRYYVYVYIDPRNFEEFYYGKGTGSRSHAHLQDVGDSVKVARIKAIQKEGLEPIIRIIA